jgi:hypothetical protein
MIEYKDIVGKRVVLIIVDGDEPDTSTLIPGVAALDEKAYMFQIKPDKEVVYEGWDEEDSVGVGCEEFENDIILKLKPDHELRKKYQAEYMIVLK